MRNASSATLTFAPRRWTDLVPAGALVFLGLAALAAASLWPSGAHGQYAVIAPPWYGLPRTIALVRSADGGLVEVGSAANVVIVASPRPDFVRALYDAGAWLVIDPMHLRGCLGFAATATTGTGEGR